jgi:hypothetical protein
MKIINELRKNPEQNPRLSPIEEIKTIFDKYGYDDVYVSFRGGIHTSDINPKNDFNTPTGFYTYPASAFKKSIVNAIENNSMELFRKTFPFASDRGTVYFLAVQNKTNVLDNDTTLETTKKYVEKMAQMYGSNVVVAEFCKRYLNDTYESKYDAGESTPYEVTQLPCHLLWLFIYDIAPYVAKGEPKNIFTKICKDVGIDGFVDKNFEGYIHLAEPAQAVFFKAKNLGTMLYVDENERNERQGDVIRKVSSYDRNRLSDILRSGKIDHMLDNQEFVKKLEPEMWVILSDEQWEKAKRFTPITDRRHLELFLSYTDEKRQLAIKDAILTLAVNNHNRGITNDTQYDFYITKYITDETLFNVFVGLKRMPNGLRPLIESKPELWKKAVQTKLNKDYKQAGYRTFEDLTGWELSHKDFSVFDEEMAKLYVDRGGDMDALIMSDIPTNLRMFAQKYVRDLSKSKAEPEQVNEYKRLYEMFDKLNGTKLLKGEQ